jgi:LemA protein
MKRTRHSGGSALLAVIVIGILVFLLFLGIAVLLWSIGGRNKAVRLDEAVNTAWADVDAQLQRRADLVPNLVGAVRGFAQQELEIFNTIAQARSQYLNASSVAGKMEASNQLGGLLGRLLMLRDQYPELKSNANFLALQDQLEGTENRISVARTRYNAAVQALNTYSREVFGSYFCRQAGVEAREPFEAAETAQTEVPAVDFSAPQAAPTPEPVGQPSP